MTFRDLYFANNKWYEVTELTIVFSGTDLETLTAKRALMLYDDFEVVVFNENVVVLKRIRSVNMTFSDLYFTNNDWERSTVLEINVGAVNKNKELTAFKALSLYSGYEVVGFSSNWVTLMAPVCLSQHKEVEE